LKITKQLLRRKCRTCLLDKPIEMFSVNSQKLKTYQYSCKECSTLYAKQRYILNKEKIKLQQKLYYKNNKKSCLERSRRSVLKNSFNLSEDDLIKMKECSNYSCEICGQKEEELNRSLHIDHNHITGKVRGLLCFKCNSAIGKLNCDITVENLLNAIDYIKRTERFF